MISTSTSIRRAGTEQEIAVFAGCIERESLAAHRSEVPCREMPDSNALIHDPVHKDEHTNADLAEVKAPKLSKSQLRKQKKVQEEHTKRQQRAQVTRSCSDF